MGQTVAWRSILANDLNRDLGVLASSIDREVAWLTNQRVRRSPESAVGRITRCINRPTLVMDNCISGQKSILIAVVSVSATFVSKKKCAWFTIHVGFEPIIRLAI